MRDFISALGNTLDEQYNMSVTENGAIGYRTTGKELLDLNFSVASLRKASPSDIVNRFVGAFLENKELAIKWLFFARDARGGLGERRTFRAIIQWMAQEYPELAKKVISLIPEYGRWDDLWPLLSVSKGMASHVVELVYMQLTNDILCCDEGKPVSLLAKWMPNLYTSSSETRKLARKLCKMLHMNHEDYRKIVSRLRKYIGVVERKMSENQWGDIEYSAVCSKANLIYNSAFLRHDEARRREYLESLEKGETKINASTLFPHEIVHRYSTSYSRSDATLEALWKALPDTVNGCNNTIVVADGSGSMNCRVGDGSVTALEVANALAIYFAERSSGQFKNKYITFSMRPQLVDLSAGVGLREKLMIAKRHNEVADTNIEAVFDLILDTAVRNKMVQSDLPQNILIVSDMEFNSCARSNSDGWHTPGAKLFEVIARRYHNAGYILPRLVFWNVNSRTGTIPVKENEAGVALVSGFSPNIAKMVMSGELDPYLCLLETLNAERYQPVADALRA